MSTMSGKKRMRSISGPASCSTPQTKKRYKCSYQKSWETEFVWVKPSDWGPGDAYCTLCKTHLNITSGARNDQYTQIQLFQTY